MEFVDWLIFLGTFIETLVSTSPVSKALSKSLPTFGGATIPMEKLTKSDSSGHIGLSQSFSIKSTKDGTDVFLILLYSWTLQIWVRPI